MLSLATRIRTATVALAVSASLGMAASAQSRAGFDAADADHDGRVTLQEYEAFTAHRLMAANGKWAQKFKEMSPEQQAARLRTRFEKLDHGHKGYLVRSDWLGG